MIYSKKFTRDFEFYLSTRHLFNFSGQLPKSITHNAQGVSGKEAFFVYDSQGKLLPTRHPNLLTCLFLTKGSVNFHIKMYAETISEGLYPKWEFQEDLDKGVFGNPPKWFKEAVINQSIKLRT